MNVPKTIKKKNGGQAQVALAPVRAPAGSGPSSSSGEGSEVESGWGLARSLEVFAPHLDLPDPEVEGNLEVGDRAVAAQAADQKLTGAAAAAGSRAGRKIVPPGMIASRREGEKTGTGARATGGSPRAERSQPDGREMLGAALDQPGPVQVAGVKRVGVRGGGIARCYGQHDLGVEPLGGAAGYLGRRPRRPPLFHRLLAQHVDLGGHRAGQVAAAGRGRQRTKGRKGWARRSARPAEVDDDRDVARHHLRSGLRA